MPTTSMYRVTQVATGVAGSPYYLTGHFNAAAGTAQQAADAWRALLSGGVATYVTGLVFSAISAVETVDPATGNTTAITAVTVAAQTFTNADQPLPAATSLLLRWRTGTYVAGREVRGRTNIPRLGELDNTLGVPAGATTTAWQARITTLLASVVASLVVYARQAGTWNTVVTGSVWDQWAVLRSRRD
jgi:hypothetical protein